MAAAAAAAPTLTGVPTQAQASAASSAASSAVTSAAGRRAAAVAPQVGASDVLSQAEADRLHALARELRCVVCQNESLADSNAPLALDLKRELAARITRGESDEALKQFLVERYGDFVSYRPPWRPSTWLLWLAPALLLGAGGWALARHWRQEGPLPPSAGTAPEPPGPAA